ncbi:MAG: transposase [Eubacteriaceae bacterium]|nr:transposase [Eubacteriaceae bacterium]
MDSDYFENTNIRLLKLSALGDPLENIAKTIDFEAFRPLLNSVFGFVPGRNGYPGYDFIMVLKIIVLQHLYSIPDDQIEFELYDRLSFARFIGLSQNGNAPSETEMLLYRELLQNSGSQREILGRIDVMLEASPAEQKKGDAVEGYADDKPSEQPSPQSKAVELERCACYDEKLGCEAARSVAPKGWRSSGGAYWIMQSGAYPATIDFHIISPDSSARVGYVSPMSYVSSDPGNMVFEGQWDSATVAIVKNCQSAEMYAYNYFKEYTGFDAKIVDVAYPEGSLAETLKQYLHGREQEMQSYHMQCAPMLAAQNAQMEYELGLDCAILTLSFAFEGEPYKARVLASICSSLLTNTQHLPLVGAVSKQTLNWDTSPLGFNYCFAREKEFEKYEFAADIFFANKIINEQWANAVKHSSSRIFSQQMEWTMQRLQSQQQHMQKIGAEYVAQSSRSYDSASSVFNRASEANSRVMDGWTNVITDREYYEGPDGGPVLLDSRYSHTYADGKGSFIQSESMLNLPSEWSEVASKGPMWP